MWGEVQPTRGLRMVMRYAHLSPAYLSAEVGLLDATPTPTPPLTVGAASRKTARKGRRSPERDQRPAKVVELPKRLAPQVGLEPTTLRLTATLSKTTGHHSRQRQRISLGQSSAGGNPRRPDSSPDCPGFVPFSNPASTRSVDARRRMNARAGVAALIGGVDV